MDRAFMEHYFNSVYEDIIGSLTEENEEVTLMMEFQSVDDYTEFNEVLLFAGTFAEAVDGYNRNSEESACTDIDGG